MPCWVGKRVRHWKCAYRPMRKRIVKEPPQDSDERVTLRCETTSRYATTGISPTPAFSLFKICILPGTHDPPGITIGQWIIREHYFYWQLIGWQPQNSSEMHCSQFYVAQRGNWLLHWQIILHSRMKCRRTEQCTANRRVLPPKEQEQWLCHSLTHSLTLLKVHIPNYSSRCISLLIHNPTRELYTSRYSYEKVIMYQTFTLHINNFWGDYFREVFIQPDI